MTKDTLLDVTALNKRFGGVHALTDFSIQIRPGEVHALLGENGAGKSTFLKILNGDVIPDSGSVVFDGHLLHNSRAHHGGAHNTHKARLLGISMVYQELSLVPRLTVAENIFLGNHEVRPRFRGIIDWGATRRKAQQLSEAFGLHLDVTQPVGNLGVGSQQLVEILRAVSSSAKLLLLDEPTSALSREEIDLLFHRVIARVREMGVAVIYISHRLDEIFEIADRVSVLRDGQRIITTDIDSITEEDLITHMVGREIGQRYIKTRHTIGEEVLRVEHVHVPGVVEDGSLNVRRGEVVALAGLMGAGRTELAKTVAGLYRKTRGTVFLHGAELQSITPAGAIRKGIAYLAEDRADGLVMPMSISENVSLASIDSVTTLGVLRKDRERRVGNEFIQRLGIDAWGENQPVRALSGGNQQKVALARWIYSDVDVFLLDEPTRGIDVGAKVEVYKVINQLLDRGKAVVLISSELPEVVSLADRVFVMCERRTVRELQGPEITQENIMVSATGGAAREKHR